jgi:eukaryotic-like serine/threonine-protein kinase
MGLSAGTRLGPYEILAPLGAGGMGEVYRARDVRLDRAVAVKVLPERLWHDPDALARFEREAKAVAALSHPNILEIHDVGEAGGVSYAVMELLEGETLRERLRDGPLPPARAVGYGVQIAEGLAAAHAKGFVHRDLKPENVFITQDGRLKILDFGIAKRPAAAGPVPAEASTEFLATEPGVLLGTAAYMSPEQVRGRPLDARSDIFSFGAVLYEMLAGSRAFPGRTQADTLAAILTVEPPALDARLPDLPPPLVRIVGRCLAKEPDERYAAARDLAADLAALVEHPSAGAGAPGPTAVTAVQRAPASRRLRRALVAVLPILLAAAAALVWLGRPKVALSFAPRDWVLVADVKNETGEPVFDRSLFTALTVSLEQSAHANVFPRARVAAALTRMKRDPGSPIDAEMGREICLRENVRALVTCNIARAGTRYMLAARIVDARTGDAFRSFEEQARGEDAVLPALSVLATRIRESLGESLPAIQRANRPLPQVTTASLKALELYAEGQQLWAKGKYAEALKMYESALQDDPGFAMAHAALGNAYVSFLYNQPSRGRECYARALELASRTTDRERLLIQAAAAAAGGDASEAMRLYGAYLATYPDDTSVRYSLGTILMQNKRPTEALEQFGEVIRIAPASANAHVNMATSLTQLGRAREALDSYAKAFALEPTWVTSGNLNHEYGFSLVRAGEIAKAREIFGKAVATTDLRAKGLRSMALLDLYEGHYRDAAPRLREAVLLNEAARNALSGSRDRIFLATVLEGQGNRAGQLAELERARAMQEGLDAGIAWPARLGSSFARAGALPAAERLRGAVMKSARPASAQDMSDLHRLDGEIELARGRPAAALEKLRLADREFRTGQTLESLAYAAWAARSLPEAVATYETLLATDSMGWEAQQPWVTAPYYLALAYRASGQVAKARGAADRLLGLWKDADPDLVMLRKTRELRHELDR